MSISPTLSIKCSLGQFDKVINKSIYHTVALETIVEYINYCENFIDSSLSHTSPEKTKTNNSKRLLKYREYVLIKQMFEYEEVGNIVSASKEIMKIFN